MHLAVLNSNRMKTSSPVTESIKSCSEYAIRLKSFWSYAFAIFGIDMCKRGQESRKKRIVFIALAITQLFIFFHYISCLIYNFALESTVSGLSFYTGMLACICLSIFNLWTMNRRKVAMTKLLDESIFFLSGHPECTKCLWRYSLIPSIGLFAMTIAEASFSSVEVFTRDNAGIRNLTAMHLFKINFAIEYLYIARILISVEFIVSVLICMGFVNISVWFFNHMCHLVFYRFKHLNMKLEELLRSGKQLSSFDLAEYRAQHQLACQVTEELSCLWSPLIVVWMFGFILGLCFNMKALQVEFRALFLIAYLTDISRQLWLIVGLFKAASLVNVEAHKLAVKLVTFPISQLAFTDADKMEYYFNYLLLSERLVNTRIGINASGLFLLNASSFLSMAGTVLTYVIVLYQSH
uniref:Gustatory receptor n=1 Tax=Strigamia maritima TaxID=126957 RepID=T1JNV2_STRMM